MLKLKVYRPDMVSDKPGLLSVSAASNSLNLVVCGDVSRFLWFLYYTSISVFISFKQQHRM